MARIAVRRCPRKNIVHVALRALHRSMRPRKRERRLRMVKLRAAPIRRCVANRTIQGEIPLHVVRVRCPLVIRQMATIAIARQCGEVTAHMALRTCNRGVHPSQREARRGVVVKRP